MSNKNFADDWIQTADLWCQKQPLYQLSLFWKYFVEEGNLNLNAPAKDGQIWGQNMNLIFRQII